MSILRTLVEHHNYSVSEAAFILRRTLQSELNEANLMTSGNVLFGLTSAIVIASSLTNPVGLVAGIAGLSLNVLSQQAHRKDYHDISIEHDLVAAAPLLTDHLQLYSETGMIAETALLAAYEYVLEYFDPNSRQCFQQSTDAGTGEVYQDFLHPADFFKGLVQQSTQEIDQNLEAAGIASGAKAFEQRVEQIQEKAKRRMNPHEFHPRYVQPDPEVPNQYIPPTDPVPQIGANTRLNAINVASEQVQDVVDQILKQGNSFVFLGGQGVGKSRLMSIASRVGMETGRFRHVTVLSSLAKSTEDPHYWQHAQTQAFCDMGAMSDRERAKALRAFLNAVREFKKNAHDQNPGLLIIDEIAYLSALLAESPKDDDLAKQLESEIQDCLRVVSSGGAKRGWFVWLGTPQGAIGDLGNIGKRLKMLKPVLCAIAPGDSVTARGNAVSWDEGLYQAALRNFPSLTTPDRGLGGRIVFFEDEWRSQTRFPEPKKVAETMPLLNDELDDRERLEQTVSESAKHPVEDFYHPKDESVQATEDTDSFDSILKIKMPQLGNAARAIANKTLVVTSKSKEGITAGLVRQSIREFKDHKDKEMAKKVLTALVTAELIYLEGERYFLICEEEDSAFWNEF